MSKNPRYLFGVAVKELEASCLVWSTKSQKMSWKLGQNVSLSSTIEFEKYCSSSKLWLNLETSNCQILVHFSDLIAHLSITQLFALENVTQYLFGTKSFYVSIRFPLSVLCMDIRSYPYSNPFVFFVFITDRLLGMCSLRLSRLYKSLSRILTA